MTRSAERHVLQFCHGYDGPFLDCARQYASLFAGTGYRVTTVFLTGAADSRGGRSVVLPMKCCSWSTAPRPFVA